MNRQELISAVADKTGVAKGSIDAVIKALNDTIVEAVAKGDKVAFVGFGTYAATDRGARTARNPQTGDKIELPAKRDPKFTPGTAFKAAVNK